MHWELDGGIIKRLSLSPPANLFPASHHRANRVPVISAYKEHGGEEASLEPPEPWLYGNDITVKGSGEGVD